MTTLKQFSLELPAIKDEAKQLFGTDLKYCSQCMRTHTSSSDCDCGGWPQNAISSAEYHLIQMLLSDDPVKYLKDNS